MSVPHSPLKIDGWCTQDGQMNELSVHAGATETRLPADFRWPGGKRLAVFFRCAFEGWSDGHWPGVGPMGNPLKPGVPDLNAIGFAEYGHRRGIFRVLDTLAREDVKATMIVSGIMEERHGDIVRRISEAGHDIVAHSYAMDVIPIYLDEDAERANIRRTVDLILAATGKCPTGWISPRGTPSPRTGRLLAEEGFEWHGDFAQQRPAVLRPFRGRHHRLVLEQHGVQRFAPLHAPRQSAARDARDLSGLARLRAEIRRGRRPDRSDHSFPGVRPSRGHGGVPAHDRHRQAGRRHLDRHTLGGGQIHPGAGRRSRSPPADRAHRRLPPAIRAR